ncbi:radical SAM protein [Conexibacter sp. CPCC 206217]|uniref:radical SAM protein n=1 Tax=Conexibacter sp. CPCC 206217 TaxID=3064574 RepID=UPI002716DF4A|nr:radical SAM protein [Conexibacter sp. CPCC 206217]MDO8210672.1 radical SAM protein [Conexibacter sp. CPCC 206217]
MRWDNLTLTAEEATRLPGYRDDAVVRRFDAPEALDMRFYEVHARSVLNRVPAQSRMPFKWTINPYRGCSHACVYCFARPTHRYLDFGPGRDFEREIVVKANAPEVLRVELARRSWKGEHVALGTNTDPYQWVEGRYKLMPGIWEALRDARNPCSVLTKSPLLLRDLALMKELVAVTDFTASLSIPTLDEKAWRATEPHTPSPRARLEAVAELNRNGIPTGVLIAPLMPGINDAPEQVEPLLAAAEDAGATSIGGIGLHLRGDVRGVFMDWLRGTRPDLVPRYQRLYARGAYAPKEERARLSALVRGRPRSSGARGWRLPASDRVVERTEVEAGHVQPELPAALPGAGTGGRSKVRVPQPPLRRTVAVVEVQQALF